MTDEQDLRKNASPDGEEPVSSCNHGEEGNTVPETEKPASKAPFLGFTGCYNHGIDAKGRMIIPASFREALGDTFVTTLTLDQKAIAIFPTKEWLKQQEMLDELLQKDIHTRKLVEHICKYSFTDTETDAQGRLLLPSKLRNKVLGDAREIEVSGARTYIRVVSAQYALDEDEEFDREFPDVYDFIASVQQK